MLITPGDRRQGPWDPDKKEKWINPTYFLTLLPTLILLLALVIIFN